MKSINLFLTLNLLVASALLQSAAPVEYVRPQQPSKTKMYSPRQLRQLFSQLPPELGEHIEQMGQSATVFDKNAQLQAEPIPPLKYLGYHLFISPDNQFIVMSERTDPNTNKLLVWNIDNKTFYTIDENNFSLPVSISSNFIISGSPTRANVARVWDLKTGQLVGDLVPRHLDGHEMDLDLSSIAISPNNKFIVTGYASGTIVIWSAAGTQLHTIEAHQNSISSIAISSDSTFIVTGSDSGEARIWNATTGQAQTNPDTGTWLEDLSTHKNVISSVAISSNNKFIVIGSRDGTASVWNAGTGELIDILKGKGYSLSQVVISSDNRLIITRDTENNAYIWDAYNKKLKYALSDVLSAAISADGKFIITGSTTTREGKFVNILDAATGRKVQTLKGFRGAIRKIACSSNNRFIVTGSVDGVLLWKPKQLPALTAISQAKRILEQAKQMPYFPASEIAIIRQQIEKLENTNLSGDELIQFTNEANKIIDNAFKTGKTLNAEEVVLQNLPTGMGHI